MPGENEGPGHTHAMIKEKRGAKQLRVVPGSEVIQLGPLTTDIARLRPHHQRIWERLIGVRHGICSATSRPKEHPLALTKEQEGP